MKKNNKKLFLTVILLIAVIAGAIYFRPLPFENLILSDSVISIACVEATTSDGKAVNNTSERTIEPGTEEYDELKAILEKYNYHRNFKSLIEAEEATGKADVYYFTISKSDGSECTSLWLGNTKEFLADWRWYDMGYFGNKKYNEFVKEFTEWYYGE